MTNLRNAPIKINKLIMRPTASKERHTSTRILCKGVNHQQKHVLSLAAVNEWQVSYWSIINPVYTIPIIL